MSVEHRIVEPLLLEHEVVEPGRAALVLVPGLVLSLSSMCMYAKVLFLLSCKLLSMSPWSVIRC